MRLFFNAREIAVIGQMLMNGGEYGGKKYLKVQLLRPLYQSTRKAIEGVWVLISRLCQTLGKLVSMHLIKHSKGKVLQELAFG